MAVWSEITWSGLGAASRLDPEYYQPEYLRLEGLIERIPIASMDAVAYVTDGIHASPDVVEEGGVRYLSAKCVKDNEFALGNALQISNAQDAANRRTRLKVGDVLLTTVGTIGNAAVVTPEIGPANIDRHLGLIRVRNGSQRWSHFVTQPAKVDSPMQRMIHHEDAETVFG